MKPATTPASRYLRMLGIPDFLGLRAGDTADVPIRETSIAMPVVLSGRSLHAPRIITESEEKMAIEAPKAEDRCIAACVQRLDEVQLLNASALRALYL